MPQPHYRKFSRGFYRARDLNRLHRAYTHLISIQWVYINVLISCSLCEKKLFVIVKNSCAGLGDLSSCCACLKILQTRRPRNCRTQLSKECGGFCSSHISRLFRQLTCLHDHLWRLSIARARRRVCSYCSLVCNAQIDLASLVYLCATLENQLTPIQTLSEQIKRWKCRLVG